MTKSKWYRLWIFLSSFLLVGTTVCYCYYVWVPATCYRIVTISISDKASTTDYSLAKELQGEQKTFCGKRENSTIETLESLAKNGAVTQIAFQWLEPEGWSMDSLDTLEIENGKEIQAQEIIHDVNTYVHKARLKNAAWWFVASIAFSIAAFLIGWGIAWVRRGQ